MSENEIVENLKEFRKIIRCIIAFAIYIISFNRCTFSLFTMIIVIIFIYLFIPLFLFFYMIYQLKRGIGPYNFMKILLIDYVFGVTIGILCGTIISHFVKTDNPIIWLVFEIIGGFFSVTLALLLDYIWQKIRGY